MNWLQRLFGYSVELPSVCRGCANKDEFIDYLKAEINILRAEKVNMEVRLFRYAGLIKDEVRHEVTPDPIFPQKKPWSEMAKDLASYEILKNPDAKEVYWRNYIRQNESVLKGEEDASKVSEAVQVYGNDSPRGEVKTEGSGPS